MFQVDERLFNSAKTNIENANDILKNKKLLLDSLASVSEPYEGKGEVIGICSDIANIQSVLATLNSNMAATQSQLGISSISALELGMLASGLANFSGELDPEVKQQLIDIVNNSDLTNDEKETFVNFLDEQNYGGASVIMFIVQCDKEIDEYNEAIEETDEKISAIEVKKSEYAYLESLKNAYELEGRGEEFKKQYAQQLEELAELQVEISKLKNEKSGYNTGISYTSAEKYSYQQKVELCKYFSYYEVVNQEDYDGSYSYDEMFDEYFEKYFGTSNPGAINPGMINAMKDRGIEVNQLALFDYMYSNKDQAGDATMGEFLEANGFTAYNSLYARASVYMTDEERKVYEEVFNSGGSKAADKYLSALEDELNKRYGMELATNDVKEFLSGKKLYESFESGVEIGVTSCGENVMAFLTNDATITSTEYRAMYLQEYINNQVITKKELDTCLENGMISEDIYKQLQTKMNKENSSVVTSLDISYVNGEMEKEEYERANKLLLNSESYKNYVNSSSDFDKTLYTGAFEVGNGVGGMLPSVAANLLCAPVGLGAVASNAVMFLSSAGGNMKQNVRSGTMSTERAYAMASLTGGIETAMEYFLGKIPGVSKSTNVSQLDDVADLYKSLTSGSSIAGFGKTTGKILLAGLADMSGEGFEEVLTEILTNAANSVISGTEYNVTADELLHTFVISSFTAGVMSAPNVAVKTAGAAATYVTNSVNSPNLVELSNSSSNNVIENIDLLQNVNTSTQNTTTSTKPNATPVKNNNFQQAVIMDEDIQSNASKNTNTSTQNTTTSTKPKATPVKNNNFEQAVIMDEDIQSNTSKNTNTSTQNTTTSTKPKATPVKNNNFEQAVIMDEDTQSNTSKNVETLTTPPVAKKTPSKNSKNNSFKEVSVRDDTSQTTTPKVEVVQNNTQQSEVKVSNSNQQTTTQTSGNNSKFDVQAMNNLLSKYHLASIEQRSDGTYTMNGQELSATDIKGIERLFAKYQKQSANVNAVWEVIGSYVDGEPEVLTAAYDKEGKAQNNFLNYVSDIQKRNSDTNENTSSNDNIETLDGVVPVESSKEQNIDLDEYEEDLDIEEEPPKRVRPVRKPGSDNTSFSEVSVRDDTSQTTTPKVEVVQNNTQQSEVKVSNSNQQTTTQTSGNNSKFDVQAMNNLLSKYHLASIEQRSDGTYTMNGQELSATDIKGIKRLFAKYQKQSANVNAVWEVIGSYVDGEPEVLTAAYDKEGKAQNDFLNYVSDIQKRNSNTNENTSSNDNVETLDGVVPVEPSKEQNIDLDEYEEDLDIEEEPPKRVRPVRKPGSDNTSFSEVSVRDDTSQTTTPKVEVVQNNTQQNNNQMDSSKQNDNNVSIGESDNTSKPKIQIRPEQVSSNVYNSFKTISENSIKKGYINLPKSTSYNKNVIYGYFEGQNFNFKNMAIIYAQMKSDGINISPNDLYYLFYEYTYRNFGHHENNQKFEINRTDYTRMQQLAFDYVISEQYRHTHGIHYDFLETAMSLYSTLSSNIDDYHYMQYMNNLINQIHKNLSVVYDTATNTHGLNEYFTPEKVEKINTLLGNYGFAPINSTKNGYVMNGIQLSPEILESINKMFNNYFHSAQNLYSGMNYLVNSNVQFSEGKKIITSYYQKCYQDSNTLLNYLNSFIMKFNKNVFAEFRDINLQLMNDNGVKPSLSAFDSKFINDKYFKNKDFKLGNMLEIYIQMRNDGIDISAKELYYLFYDYSFNNFGNYNLNDSDNAVKLKPEEVKVIEQLSRQYFIFNQIESTQGLKQFAMSIYASLNSKISEYEFMNYLQNSIKRQEASLSNDLKFINEVENLNNGISQENIKTVNEFLINLGLYPIDINADGAYEINGLKLSVDEINTINSLFYDYASKSSSFFQTFNNVFERLTSSHDDMWLSNNYREKLLPIATNLATSKQTLITYLESLNKKTNSVEDNFHYEGQKDSDIDNNQSKIDKQEINQSASDSFQKKWELYRAAYAKFDEININFNKLNYTIDTKLNTKLFDEKSDFVPLSFQSYNLRDLYMAISNDGEINIDHNTFYQAFYNYFIEYWAAKNDISIEVLNNNIERIKQQILKQINLETIASTTIAPPLQGVDIDIIKHAVLSLDLNLTSVLENWATLQKENNIKIDIETFYSVLYELNCQEFKNIFEKPLKYDDFKVDRETYKNIVSYIQTLPSKSDSNYYSALTNLYLKLGMEGINISRSDFAIIVDLETKTTSKNLSNMKKEILATLSPSMTKMEIIRKLYIELNKRVHYDMDYAKASEKLQYSMHTADVTFVNLKSEYIICKEWAQLYRELLLEVGFSPDDVIIKQAAKSSLAHRWIVIKLSDEDIVIADATEIINHSNELVNSKIGDKLYGLVKLNKKFANERLKILYQNKEYRDKLMKYSEEQWQKIDQNIKYSKKGKYFTETLTKAQSMFGNSKIYQELFNANTNSNESKFAILKSIEIPKEMDDYETYIYFRNISYILFKQDRINVYIKIKKVEDEARTITIINVESNDNHQFIIYGKDFGMLTFDSQESCDEFIDNYYSK